MRGKIGVLVAAAALLLTGCSAAAAPAPEATTASAPPAAAETSARLTAEAPDSSDATFLTTVRGTLRPDNVIPNATDEQLLEAGWKACSLLSSGGNPDDYTVIEGEQRNEISGMYLDSVTIINAAAITLCV